MHTLQTNNPQYVKLNLASILVYSDVPPYDKRVKEERNFLLRPHRLYLNIIQSLKVANFKRLIDKV